LDPRIPLGLYVTVNTALHAGMPQAAVLVAAGLTEDEWVLESAAWGRVISRLLDDDDPESHALDEHDAEVLAARDRLARRVEPLDDDVSAWLAFQAASVRAPDPTEFLEARGLTALDMMRIASAWTQRMSTDGDLRMEALRGMERTDGPVPEVRVGPWPLESAFAGLRVPAGAAPAPPPAAPAPGEGASAGEESAVPLWTALPGASQITPADDD
jgi:hypothetical protein